MREDEEVERSEANPSLLGAMLVVVGREMVSLVEAGNRRGDWEGRLITVVGRALTQSAPHPEASSRLAVNAVHRHEDCGG